MMNMGKKVSDVLGPPKQGEPRDSGDAESSEPSYDAFSDELKDILGLDDDKAQRLRDAICGLAREEMEMGGDEGADSGSSDEGESEPPKGKKAGLAIILGGK